MDGQIDKKWHTHTMRCLSVFMKEEILSLATTWIEVGNSLLGMECLGEDSQRLESLKGKKEIQNLTCISFSELFYSKVDKAKS